MFFILYQCCISYVVSLLTNWKWILLTVLAFKVCVRILDRYFHWVIFYYIFQNSYSIDIKYKYALVSHCVTMIYTLLLYIAGFLVNQINFYLFIYLFIYLIYSFFGGEVCYFKTKIILDTMDKLHRISFHYCLKVICHIVNFWNSTVCKIFISEKFQFNMFLMFFIIRCQIKKLNIKVIFKRHD